MAAVFALILLAPVVIADETQTDPNGAGSCRWPTSGLSTPTTTSVKVDWTTTVANGHMATVSVRIGIVVVGNFNEVQSFTQTLGPGNNQPGTQTFSNLMTGQKYTVKMKVTWDNFNIQSFTDRTATP